MKKNQYHHGDLKNSIIDASVKMIQAEGIKMLSLRNVAQEIGVSHSAIYRHYKSKDDLVVSMAMSGFSELSGRMDMAADKYPDDPVKRIAEMGKTYIKYAVEKPVYYRLMFGDYIADKTGHPELFQIYDAMFRRVTGILAECHVKKMKKTGDNSITAVSIWSLLHGYSCLIIDNMKDKNVGSRGQINLVIEKLLLMI